MNAPNAPRRLAKLLRELLDAGRFETIADVADALKTRAARLHLRYTADDVTQAIALVGSNRPIVGSEADA